MRARLFITITPPIMKLKCKKAMVRIVLVDYIVDFNCVAHYQSTFIYKKMFVYVQNVYL